ncbi:hypothetical protein [Neisseria animaloris]|uniref:hypothetical protein n=1 Tax=Neisseria animaloris TaxID=326522 RepID=UPI000D35229B|nr:hypothetical protein [Neisseria animaloris]
MKISNIAKQAAQAITQIGGGATNMYGALTSFGEAVSKGDAGSILSTGIRRYFYSEFNGNYCWK